MVIGESRRDFLARLGALVPALRSDADAVDAGSGFPDRSLQALREVGALAAPLPAELGGFDLGVGAQGYPAAEFLRLLGTGSIAIGRLLEGHVNALRLIWRYGSAGQFAGCATDAGAGHLFGIWVTELDRPVHLCRAGEGFVLEGMKNFCSGAGRVTRALLTAAPAEGPPVLVLARLTGSEPIGPARSMSGVRGARTADMDLSGVAVGASDIVGAPGDYLRQPEFSAGAWRGSAVALGGLDALVEMTVAQLRDRGRHTNPHQAARIGRMLIAAETARMWVGRASVDGLGDGETAGLVNLARIAVERACLDAIEEMQRALGLSAFVSGNPVERILRDLSTYLRQPAPDETLTEAALWFAGRGLPVSGQWAL